jgi:hypothetical protein
MRLPLSTLLHKTAKGSVPPGTPSLTHAQSKELGSGGRVAARDEDACANNKEQSRQRRQAKKLQYICFTKQPY